MSGTARSQVQDVIAGLVDQYLVGDYVEDWDIDGLLTQLEQIYPVAIAPEDIDPHAIERQILLEELQEDAISAYDEREKELGPELMREIERFSLLQIIDERWREHLHDMDYLREGIHLRGFAQEDPLVAYKNEGFEMFTALIQAIWEEFARFIFHVEVQVEGPNGDGQTFAPQQRRGNANLQYAGGGANQPSALAAAAAGVVPGEVAEAMAYGDDGELAEPVHVETRRVSEQEQIGRNDPCWCGSGKKFKKCHGV
jgi:preprotein translocase subunit SecA